MKYEEFLKGKTHSSSQSGLELKECPGQLFEFQKDLVDWSLRKGRSAIFADCGLGKTAMQLTWGKNVYQQTGKPVLVLTPLAVSEQTVEEGEKFGIEVVRDSKGVAIPRY